MRYRVLSKLRETKNKEHWKMGMDRVMNEQS